MPPIKILDNLYVFGILEGTPREMEEFRKLSEVDKIEILVSEDPLAKKIKANGSEPFYSPVFGRFVISNNENKHLEYKDQRFTRIKSEELFAILEEEYISMNWAYDSLESFIYSKKKL